jgi:hypothetical protein
MAAGGETHSMRTGFPALRCRGVRRVSSSNRSEWVKVFSAPPKTGLSAISTRDSFGSSWPLFQRPLITTRSGNTNSRNSPLHSCSVPSSIRKRTGYRPPLRGSASGPHHCAMPSAVVTASNTIDGRALMRRTRVRLVIPPAP